MFTIYIKLVVTARFYNFSDLKSSKYFFTKFSFYREKRKFNFCSFFLLQVKQANIFEKLVV